MHAVVMESLEDYLAGTLEPAEVRVIETHLNTCERCREEIRGMESVSQMFVSLKSEEQMEASPAFFSGIMEKTGVQRNPSAIAAWFDLAFGRRLVFASLLTLALTSGYLVTHESHPPAAMTPAAIMAQQDAPGFDSAPATDNMLVTLTAYER